MTSLLLYIHDDSLYSVRSLYFCIIFVFLFLYLLKYGGSVLPNILAVRNYLNYLNLFISFHYSGNSLFIYKVYTCSFYKLINLHLVTVVVLSSGLLSADETVMMTHFTSRIIPTRYFSKKCDVSFEEVDEPRPCSYYSSLREISR